MSKPKSKTNTPSQPAAAPVIPDVATAPAGEPSVILSEDAAPVVDPVVTLSMSIPKADPLAAPVILDEDQQAKLLARFTHRIAGNPEKGFYRAGRHWPREGVEVNCDDFTDEQWELLTSEPRLAVTPL